MGIQCHQKFSILKSLMEAAELKERAGRRHRPPERLV